MVPLIMQHSSRLATELLRGNQVLGPPSKLWPGATVRSQNVDNVETHLAEIRLVDTMVR